MDRSTSVATLGDERSPDQPEILGFSEHSEGESIESEPENGDDGDEENGDQDSNGGEEVVNGGPVNDEPTEIVDVFDEIPTPPAWKFPSRTRRFAR